MVDWAKRGIMDTPPYTVLIEAEEARPGPEERRRKDEGGFHYRWACSCGSHGIWRTTQDEALRDAAHHQSLHRPEDVRQPVLTAA
jgi:hypothetical protein